ncbi:MAG: AAA family ATPase [Eubacteriales bacterium]|nr:AAA family ATPase [Eubacteriales bacterium]
MNIYLNPGYENFRRALSAEIYVDKTMMIARTNRFIDTGNNYVCVSRPRRFGKTITNNMLSAYYSKGCDARELFAPFKIASDPGFTGKLNRFNVIQIDMNSEYQNTRNKDRLLDRLTEEIKEEMSVQFPQVRFREDDSLAQSILRIYAATGETFVFLLDEYDVLVREQVPEPLFAQYLSFLNGLFKSASLRPAISLAYLTGIMPVVRDKVQSKLNNFREYTILNAGPLADFVGFTGEEVRALCRERGRDFEECRRWYDGYRQHGYEIYNPESVVRSMEEGYYAGFWSMTSSYAVIADLIRKNFKGTKDDVVRMLSGENVDVNVTSFMNTMDSFATKDDLFTCLLHVGYLAYNEEDGTCRIPNREVRQEWFNAVAAVEDYAITDEIIRASKDLLQETLRGNEEAVARALDVSHIHVTSNRSYNNEDALQSAIYLAYIYALNRYTVIREMTSGKGFADVIFIPYAAGAPAMVIELKRNACAESAIDQIRRKQYFDSLSHYQGDLLFVGINYDEKEKTHSCRIERFVKQ